MYERRLAAMKAVQFCPQKSPLPGEVRIRSSKSDCTPWVRRKDSKGQKLHLCFKKKKKIRAHILFFSLAARSELVPLSPGQPAVPGAHWRSRGAHHQAVWARWTAGAVGTGLKPLLSLAETVMGLL